MFSSVKLSNRCRFRGIGFMIARVQRKVREVGGNSCERLEAVLSALPSFVQRREVLPTAEHHAGRELGHLFAKVCRVESSCSRRSETVSGQGGVEEQGAAVVVVPQAASKLRLLGERQGEEEDERKVGRRASPNLVCIFWEDAFYLSFSLVWLLKEGESCCWDR